jgi:hypothetical protein
MSPATLEYRNGEQFAATGRLIAWPSKATIAEEIGITPRHVQEDWTVLIKLRASSAASATRRADRAIQSTIRSTLIGSKKGSRRGLRFRS